ncbi:lytic transglycosylase domain-containing protein [Corallococcus exiguus]|uniref:Transglycosylase SLT domain-containing protein n=1 Tax=Corallococcus exiguus TaxID=83462 RepID=A0A7X4YEF2_9BACT|nr:lytic transglycosylase domain-containing protein [Corallococcus exiguus]NBC43956.1 transglycosylase SLT domain-containing protein [Corallococcus exiguus]TNV60693.1 lytic transglycosylase domain-containing protein [Corallococcus exiguus]
MAISPLRSTSASVSRLPVQDAASPCLAGRPGGVDGFSSSQKPGSPGLAAFQKDGFDIGSGKGAELGKLLQDTLSALTSIVQLVAQAVPGGAQALQGVSGAQGAQGASGGKCGTGSQSFSDSSFTPQDTSRPPVALNGNTGVVGPSASQSQASNGNTGVVGPTTSSSSGGTKLGGNLPAGLEKFRGAIESAAAKTGMPAEMLAAQIWQESRGNLDAVTTNGGNGLTDTGLMQVNPNTYGELQAKHPELQGKNLSDPETNILAGAFYMKDMKEQFGSDELALRAYNSGPNGVDKSNPDAIPAGTGDATYVQKVKSFMNTLATGQGSLPA